MSKILVCTLLSNGRRTVTRQLHINGVQKKRHLCHTEFRSCEPVRQKYDDSCISPNQSIYNWVEVQNVCNVDN